MCKTCGCDDTKNLNITVLGNKELSKDDVKAQERLLVVEQNVLAKNDDIALANRSYFKEHSIVTFNLMSSPGSGKTSLLEKMIVSLKGELDFYVIEGDQSTINDARRIEATGAPVIQVNTGEGCHLDSSMISRAISLLKPQNGSILMIENVGNLVCPSMFDLGEHKKIVIISTTEGEDKPIKYPSMFSVADICIINKIDLLPYLDFSVEKCKEYARQVKHDIEFIELSAKSGEGMDSLYSYIKEAKMRVTC